MNIILGLLCIYLACVLILFFNGKMMSSEDTLSILSTALKIPLLFGLATGLLMLGIYLLGGLSI